MEKICYNENGINDVAGVPRHFFEWHMNTVKVKAYAKINLTLEITGIEGGYHTLDSLVASVDLYDLIHLKKKKGGRSSITMKGMGSESLPPEKNNALKAAEAFSEVFGTDGAEITVFVNIPMGAGLGGSSADVAGVLNGMAKLYGVTDRDKLKEIADGIGSDTGYMLNGGYARLQGRGEKVEQLDLDVKLYALLLCPYSSVSAGGCYAAYDTQPKTLEYRGCPTEDCIRALCEGKVQEGGMYLTNDLFRASCSLNEEVYTAYRELESFSPIATCMTGSGSGVFALFETRELCEWAKSRYKGKFRAYVIETIIPDYAGKKGLKNPFVLENL